MGLAFNFVGFFIYVMSAPVFLMQHSGRAGNRFSVAVRAGDGCVLMSGARVSGRLAGRRSLRQTVAYGYAVMLCAALLNLLPAYAPPPGLPWSVLAIFVYTFGMSMAKCPASH